MCTRRDEHTKAEIKNERNIVQEVKVNKKLDTQGKTSQKETTNLLARHGKDNLLM